MATTNNCHKLLAVHGYEVTLVDDVPVFSSAARAVCEHVVKAHERYMQILLLGGWDSPKLPPNKTIAMMMRDFLINNGVPGEKIVLPNEVPGLEKYMPARDSAEEAMLVHHFCFHHEFQTRKLHTIVALPWLGRMRYVYRTLHLQCQISPVIVSVSKILQIKLRIVQALAFFDSIGYENCLPVGRLFRLNRKSRSFTQPNSFPPDSKKQWLIP